MSKTDVVVTKYTNSNTKGTVLAKATASGSNQWSGSYDTPSITAANQWQKLEVKAVSKGMAADDLNN